MVEWDGPSSEGNAVIVRGRVPPGLPISGVILTITTNDGSVTEITHEIEMTPLPPATPLDIDETITAAVDGAFAEGCPVIVSYVDADGAPHTSFRGTVQVYSATQLALWVRDRNGGLLRALPGNDRLNLLYRNPATRVVYEFHGRGLVSDDAQVRNQVFDRSPSFEQGLDPARRGAAVLIDIETVTGGPPDRRVNMSQRASASQ